MDDIYPSRWAPQHPDRIQLYSVATPNGQKVGIALEEMGLPYEAHKVHIGQGDQHDEGFKRISPNEKIPAIIDPDGPGGRPVAIFESGAILLHLADKSGKLISADPVERLDTIQWLFFQMASVGPFFGQFGHFYKFAKGKTDEYGENRYADETKRLLGVLDRRLEGREFLVGDTVSIADVATVPWIKALDFYEGRDRVELDAHRNVTAWVDRCWSRPAFQRGKDVNPF